MVGSNAPRSVQAQDGSRLLQDSIGAAWCRIIESVEPGGQVIGSHLYRVEGTHEVQITTREPVGWRQFPIIHVLFSGGQALGVPAGWNRPASCCGRNCL